MQTFAINTDFDMPIKTRHIAFFAEGDTEEVQLCELVENTYNGDNHLIRVLETRRVGPLQKRGSTRAAPAEMYLLLDATTAMAIPQLK